LEDIINKIKKTDKKIIFIFGFLIVIVILMLTSKQTIKKQKVEKFSFDDSSQKTDFASVLNKQKSDMNKQKEEFNKKISDLKNNLDNKIKNIKKENILKEEFKDGQKFVTTKNGNYFKVTEGKASLIKNLMDEAISKLGGTVVDSIELPDGSRIITMADGRKFLVRPDGSIVELKDFHKDKNGNYILTTKDGKLLIADKNGIRKLKVDENGNVFDGNKKLNISSLDGNIIKNAKHILTALKSAIDKNGCKYTQKKDGVYKKCPGKKEIKVGKKLFIDENGNIIVDGKKMGKAISYKKKDNSFLNKDNDLVFASKLVTGPDGKKYLNKIFEDENGKYIMTPDGKKHYVKDAWFDENGNLVWIDKDGNQHTSKQLPDSYVFSKDKNGNMTIIGKGNILLDKNGKPIVNISKYVKTKFGFSLYSFIDENNNFYEEKNNKIYKNNILYSKGNLYYNVNKKVVNIIKNSKIKEQIDLIKEKLEKTIEFKTKEKNIYKYMDTGNLVKITPNGEITNLGDKTLKIKNNNLIIIDKNNKEESHKLSKLNTYNGYITETGNMLISINNYYVNVDFKNINNITTFFKERTKLAKEKNTLVLKTETNKPRYIFDLKNIKKVQLSNNKYKIGNITVKNGKFSNSELSNFKEKKLFISNVDLNSFNNKNISYITRLPKINNQTKILGNLYNRDNKIFIKTNLKDYEYGKLIKTIDLIVVKDKGAVFKIKGMNYLINKYFIKSLGKGIIKLKNGKVVLINEDGSETIIGESSPKDYSKYQNLIFTKDGVLKDTKSLWNNKNNNKLKPKEGRYAKYGEFFLLENNIRAFFNPKLEIILIKNMSDIINKGLGQLVIYSNKVKNTKHLFILQKGYYKNLGKIISINIRDNTIYKTNKGTYYITNDNVNKLVFNKVIDMELIPKIEKSSLYGIDVQGKKIFLGKILNILSGKVDISKKSNKESNKKIKENFYNKNGQKVDEFGNIIDGKTTLEIKKEEQEKATKMLNKDDLSNLFDVDTKKFKKIKKIKKINKTRNSLLNRRYGKIKFKMVSMVSTKAMKKNKDMNSLENKKEETNNYYSDNFNQKMKMKKIYLPIGTKLSATLEGGAIAPLPIGKQGKSAMFDDNIVLFKINKDITLADGTEIPVNKAYISAKPIATSIKRMIFQLKQLHFYDEDNDVWMLSNIKGQVFSKIDAVNGIPGVIIDEKDKYLAKATIYSMLSGITEFLTATKSPLNAANLTSSTPNLNSSLAENVSGGMGKSIKNLQDTVMAMVNAQVAMLVVRNGEEATIRITRPTLLKQQK